MKSFFVCLWLRDSQKHASSSQFTLKTLRPASGDNLHLTSFLSLGESAVLHVYVFQRRYRVRVHRHVAPHAGSQGYWVMMNSGTANGGSQLSSWITEDGVGRQWMFVGGACSHHSSCETPLGTESCRV